MAPPGSQQPALIQTHASTLAGSGLTSSTLVDVQVSSCFSQLLNLHNLSEEISNAQLERAVRIGEVGACSGCL